MNPFVFYFDNSGTEAALHCVDGIFLGTILISLTVCINVNGIAGMRFWAYSNKYPDKYEKKKYDYVCRPDFSFIHRPSIAFL